MKQNILLLFSLLLTFGLAAQNLEFSTSPVVVSDLPSSEFEGVGYATIVNTADTERNLTWERNVIEKTEAWGTAVCDNVQCYFPNVDTADFMLAPNSDGTMDVHAYPGGVDGSAVVEVIVTDRDDASLSVSNVYYFNADPSSTVDVTRQQIKVYPNPSTGLFSVKAGKQLATVQVFSLTGQQVKNFTYNDGQWYDISDLPKGTYVVRLIDRDAQQLVTKLMHKL
ncbi:MAG: T9SS type A sorting domain-containing protein [Bacteroidota bacterium]